MAELEKLELSVRGMTCDSCALHVTKALKSVPGVQDVDVPGWQAARASVTAEVDVTPEALTSAVREAGYSATVRSRRSSLSSFVPVSLPGVDGNSGNSFYLMVIGGGSSGFAAAIKGAELGFKVALVEAGPIGGPRVHVCRGPAEKAIRAGGVC